MKHVCNTTGALNFSNAARVTRHSRLRINFGDFSNFVTKRRFKTCRRTNKRRETLFILISGDAPAQELAGAHYKQLLFPYFSARDKYHGHRDSPFLRMLTTESALPFICKFIVRLSASVVAVVNNISITRERGQRRISSRR